MELPRNDPSYWYLRADKMRTLADQLHDVTAKRQLERAAESYERLGKLAERRPVILELFKAANES